MILYNETQFGKPYFLSETDKRNMKKVVLKRNRQKECGKYSFLEIARKNIENIVFTRNSQKICGKYRFTSSSQKEYGKCGFYQKQLYKKNMYNIVLLENLEEGRIR